VLGGVPATSGGRYARLAGAAHESGAVGRFGGSARAHTGHAGRHCRTGGADRPARHVGGLLGAHNEMTTARGLVRVTRSDATEGWDAWAQVATAHR
jgi:hypothetical protein